MGSPAHPRGGGGRRRPGGVRRRVRDHLQPRRPAPRYGVPTAGTSAHSLHPAARHRARTRSAPRSTRWARARRCWSTPTTSPRRCALAVEVAGTGLGAVRLDSGDLGVLAHAGARPARRARRHRHPDRRHLRPRRVRDRRAGRGPGRRLRRRHLAGHRQRPPDLRVRLQAGRPRGRRTAPMVDVAKKSTDKISVGGRKYALRRRDARRRRRGRGGRRRRGRRTTTATTGRCSSRWSSRATVVGREPARPAARERHQAARAELPLRARQLSRGEPVIPTLHEAPSSGRTH